MADLPFRTQNVSIEDEDTGVQANVNASNELLVHDADVVTAIETISITDAWEQYVKDDKGYAVTYTATISGRDPTDYLMVKNPTGSGVDLIIKYIGFSIQATATLSSVYFYKNPTVTADGTALTEVNLHTDSVTGEGEAYHTPTVSARGTALSTYTISSLGSSSMSLDRELGIRIKPGKYFLVVIDPESNNTTYNVNILWAEDTEI